MEEFYKYFSWGFIAIGGISGVGLLIRHLAQAKVNYYFSKQLDQHRHDLAIITRNAEYDISKKMFDFEAYAAKRHSVYPELYRAAFEPWDRLSNFNLIVKWDSKDDVMDFDEKSLELRFDKEFTPIVNRLAIAYDYFYMNELYLSENTAKAYGETLKVLRDLAEETLDVFYGFRTTVADINKRNYTYSLENEGETKIEAAEKIQILKEIIYKELSYTHSE